MGDEVGDSSYTTIVSKVKPDLENIRILPERIIFDDPFEGKCFESEIVLQNVGTTSKFVRILDPTSSNIKMKTAKKGIFLPPGMKIKRKIKYTVVMATLMKSCVIPIYVNRTLIPYQCEVKIDRVIFEVIPPEINFGLIDAGPIIAKQKMKLVNNGLKPSRYCIDLGLNELNIQVEPMKGIVMENNSVTVTIELKASYEGSFKSEFWVIADTPICVNVFVNVVRGIIECIHEDAMNSFTFIKFPLIYYGTKSMKSVMLKNRSQLPSLFCIANENSSTSMHLADIKNSENDYKHFHISPLDGRLPSNDKRPFIFIYEPTFDKCNKRYRLILITIHKIACSDIGMCKYPEDIFRKSEVMDGKDMFTGSVSSVSSEGFLLSSDFLEDEQEDNINSSTDKVSVQINVVLLGETEQASVSTLPDELCIKDPIVGETVTRTLILTNNSKNLPIYYKYVKVTFVEVNPQMGLLKARESKEIVVKITPESCTDIAEFIKFELLYHDVPKVDGCTLKVIGSTQVPITFQAVFPKQTRKRDFVTANTFPFDKPNVKPDAEILAFLKKESAMLALPNDRPSSLKPWKNSRRCRTIYAAIPRPIEVIDSDYMLTKSKTELNRLNQSYYQHYLQSIRSVSAKVSGDSNLSLSIAKRLEAHCINKNPKKRGEVIHADFLPLTPMQLFNIEITPVDGIVEGVVSRSSFSNTISVTNKNYDAIRVYIRPQKMHSFYFPNGDRMVIGPRKTETNTYMCFTEASGTRTHMIDIIVNENHIFTASLTVKVSPAILELSNTDIIFQPNDPPYKYLEISNTLNAAIDFVWDFTGDFTIDPLEGCVKPGQAITCCIHYEAGRCTANNYELQIRMDNKRLKMVRVRIDKLNFNLHFTEVVDFSTLGKDLAASISAKLENRSVDDLPFKFDTSTLEEGITVNPESGVLPRKGFLMINFTSCRSEIGYFKCETVLTYARYLSKTVTITGTYQFPKVVFSCDSIRFRKMTASSFDIKCFTVSNISDVMAAIKFDVGRYPEIHYSEYSDSKFLEESDTFYIPARSQKVFAVHLYPFYPTATSFHLPIKVNGLEHSTDRSCPSIKVYISTLNHRILIDTWQYSFTYFPHYDHKSHTEENIVMKVKDYTKLCIRLDELRRPFFFEHVRGGILTNYPYSVVFELEAEEELVFKLLFEPETPGNYLMKLPVYVREDISEDMHNYLYVKGDYPLTTIEFDCEQIYFGFVPCSYKVIKNIEVTLKNHQPDCLVDTFIDDCNVSIEFENPVMAKSCKFQAKILFSASDMHMVNTHIKFMCSCGVVEKLRCIGGTENNMLTIYSYIMYYQTLYDMTPENLLACNIHSVESNTSMGISNVEVNLTPFHLPPFTSLFPYFPTEDNAYTRYMEKLVTSTEKWLYEQIFHRHIYYKIPDSICICEVLTKTGKKGAVSDKYCNIPFFNVLKYYCDKNISNIINIEYTKDTYSPSWICGVYYNILDFLKQVGAMLPHVEPEFLLDYDTYTNYMKTKDSTENILSPTDFYLISKQCWLDMILQTFKALDYQRISRTASAKSSCNLRKTLMCSIQGGLEQFRGHNHLSSNIYSNECEVLLAWLDKVFAEQKHKLASSAFSVDGSYNDIKDKSILNFTSDLTDCLAFCAATIKYCPYLAYYLKGIYVPAATRDEAFHNACLLIKVWDMLDISFTLTPTELTEMNPVLMQLFISYIYEFLPHMQPSDTMHFSAELGKKHSESVVAGNTNTVSIKYNIKIFNNIDEIFLSTSSITIAAGRYAKFKVTYFAKFIRKHTATLLLNGEVCSAKYFTNSKVYTLIGEPKCSTPLLELTFSSIIYEQKEVEAEIQTPFRKSATYELFCTNEEPTSFDSLKLWPYSILYKSRILARAYIKNYIFESSSSGVITLTGSICAITNSKIKYWCFFKSSIGDFYATLSCTSRPNVKDVVPLYVDLAADIMSRVCTCRHQEPDIENITCPRNVKISIPAINKSLWNAVISLYTKDADEKEKMFWMKHQETDIGPVLLKKLLEHMKQDVTTNMSYIFNENITYNISGNTEIFSYAPNIQINTTLGTVDTIIHLNSNSKNIIITLESEDCCETRRYKIIM